MSGIKEKFLEENAALRIRAGQAEQFAAELQSQLAKAQSDLAGHQAVVRRMTTERDTALRALENAHAEYGAVINEATRLLSLVRTAWMGQAPDYIADILQFLKKAE